MIYAPVNDERKTAFIRKIRAEFVDTTTTHPLYNEFVAFMESRAPNDHNLRYCQTFAALLNDYPSLNKKDTRVLETGGFSVISEFLIDCGYTVAQTTTDLRYTIDADDTSCDLVFSLEVIEHIKDQQEQNFSEVVLFQESGVRQYVNEIRRVLKPGGLLMLTTPNPCSLRSLTNILEYQPPMVFRPHVREYTAEELKVHFSNFEVARYVTHFSFFFLGNDSVKPLKDLAALGFSPEHRGDDHFFLFRKLV